ncbi:MAG: hypothetical protein WBZ36_01100 [Candidatus Nitrosopolaris sp.]
MNRKSTMAFSAMTLVALVALFASGPIIVNQQAFGLWHGDWGWHHNHWHHNQWWHHNYW